MGNINEITQIFKGDKYLKMAKQSPVNNDVKALIENQIGEDFTPDPISLLESSRNLGYSIEEAISDLIDNSITAGAKNITYEFHWNKGVPYFLLKDDGKGMSNEKNELINSFKLGAEREKKRSQGDLGRFGFGMKTASLSQARILTVITKKKGSDILARSLDLVFIANLKQGWKLKLPDNNVIKNEVFFLANVESGTIVRWDDWDRAPKSKNDFTSLITEINNYLSVCFHRFIENGLKLYCHKTLLFPCSPIPPNDGAKLYSKKIIDSNAKQSAYILQHPKYWAENYENISRFNSFKLFEGLERHQGIYIYRCDRLLTPKGGWLGQIKKGNSAKLARVVIDYSNNADHLWSLDITKTNASIPYEFKEEIKDLIEAAKNESLNKIIRGNRVINENLNTANNALIWKTSKDSQFNAYKYEIDFEHPMFKYYVSEKLILEKNLKLLLDLISNNLPVSKIIQNNDDDPSKHDRIYKKERLNEEELIHLRKIFMYQCTKMTRAAAFSWILSFEPYCYYESQLKVELSEQ
jgi:hypothetical protein